MFLFPIDIIFLLCKRLVILYTKEHFCRANQSEIKGGRSSQTKSDREGLELGKTSKVAWTTFNFLQLHTRHPHLLPNEISIDFKTKRSLPSFSKMVDGSDGLTSRVSLRASSHWCFPNYKTMVNYTVRRHLTTSSFVLTMWTLRPRLLRDQTTAPTREPSSFLRCLVNVLNRYPASLRENFLAKSSGMCPHQLSLGKQTLQL